MNRAPLPLLYRDAHLLAVSKPAGLLMHPSRIERRARYFAVQMARDQVGAPVFPAHRLDRPTSGVLLFALSPEVARRLAVAFQNGRIAKTYLAVVRGYAPEAGRIDQPLKQALCKIADADVDPDKEAQAAVTAFRRLARVEIDEAVDKYPTSRYSLVAAWPRTGRRHQIRRHLRRLGHPIVGDTSYGQGVHNRFFPPTLRLFAHAPGRRGPGVRPPGQRPAATDSRAAGRRIPRSGRGAGVGGGRGWFLCGGGALSE